MNQHETTETKSPAYRFFNGIIAIRWPILILSILTIIGIGMHIPKLVKDTGPDAFIKPDSPALIYRDKVEEIFGLKDPIVVAIINKGQNGIYNPASLTLVEELTEKVSQLKNVDPDRVTSLATESNIVGTFDGMLVEKFFERDAEGFKSTWGTQARADEIRAALSD